MEIEINYIAVVFAAVSTMIVGSVWYMPSVFGKIWMKLAHVKADQNVTPKQMTILFGSVFIAALVTAYVLAHVAFLSHHFFERNFLQDSLVAGFLLWLGLVAARMFTHDAFEGRRRKLTLLNLGNEFVTIMVMALVIGLMGL